jgi:hypothetical protein
MTRTPRVAITIRGATPTANERCLEKVVDFFGIERKTVAPDRALDEPATHGVFSPYSVLLSAECLGPLIEPRSDDHPLRGLLRGAQAIFVHDFDSSAASRHLLASLTGLSPDVVGVERGSDGSCSVAGDRFELCGPLSGITAECTAAKIDRRFVGVRRSAAFRGLISAGAGDVFFECPFDGARLFVSAAGLSLDIDAPVEGTHFDVRRCFASIVPLVIFLRDAFPGTVGSEQTAGAALVVDDPLLKPRYGFLHFGRTLASMTTHDFSTTIAFIPWNWRRTNRKTAELFLKNVRRYSLAIHGCDHTSREFGTRSLTSLNHKVKTARKRAERHLQATGIRVSPIMVFPQGVFSPEAAYVLKCNNFIAAVNTEANPSGEAIPHTQVRELWRVAIMQYSSFPIFTRRYITDGLENFAFDILLGKPCLLVAHHEVFRDGARDLTAFVHALNSLPGGVRWGTLEHVVTRSYLSRRDSDGHRYIRMFGNQIVLDDGVEGGSVVVEKAEADQAAVARVTCDRREVPWEWHEGTIRFRIDTLLPGSLIKVEYLDPLGESVSRDGAKYRVSVRVRRYLSELRDDYICRSERLNNYAARMLRLLR